MSRWLPALLAAAAVAWLVLLVSGPLLPPLPQSAMYVAGSLVCHQRSDRSFHVGAAQLPVCGRCIGIYGGFAATAVLLARRLGADTLPRRVQQWAPGHARLVLAAGIVPVALSVVVEWSGLWATSNVDRAATGMALGAAVALVAMATLHYDRCA